MNQFLSSLTPMRPASPSPHRVRPDPLHEDGNQPADSGSVAPTFGSDDPNIAELQAQLEAANRIISD